MRLLRSLVAGALTLVSVLVVAAGEARAAAPTAPYTALTLDGTWNFTFDSSNASINLAGATTTRVVMTVTSGFHDFTAIVEAPTGQDFTVGTFPALRMADATHAGIDVGGDGAGCNTQAGSITISEVVRDPGTHAITALAVSYAQTACLATSGEIRWQSSVPYAAGTAAPPSLDFGSVPVADTTPAQTVTFTSTGPTALSLGTTSVTGTNPDAFSITADTCSHASLAWGQSCSVSVAAQPTGLGQQSAAVTIPDNTTFGKRTAALSVVGLPNARGSYLPLAPQRLLDTRNGTGTGGHVGPLGPNATLHLQVTGQGGVPSSGVSAVVLNVTATAPTGPSFLTVYPTGVARPTASNLNFPPGWTGANSVTVPVGSGGQIDIYNHVGSVHVIADVVGFYLANNSTGLSGGDYLLTAPTRLLDTRDPALGGPLPLPARGILDLSVDFGTAGNPHIRALAVNVTAVDPSAAGFLATWDGQGDPPGTSTLNFTPHAIVPNLAVIPTGPCSFDPSCFGVPEIAIYNGSPGTVHVIVDIFGFYDDGSLAGGLRFHPITPTRIADSRIGLGAPHTFGAGEVETVTTPASIADASTIALATNVTAVNPTTSTYITVWPAAPGLDRPTVSNLNPTAGQIIPNAVFTGIGPGAQFNIFNHSGTVDVVVDVSGTFIAAIPPALRAQALAEATIVVRPGRSHLRHP